jgi:predicted AAA+ superfamily ATPase
LIQVVAGSRQVGKTTLVQQVVAAAGVPVRYASADGPTVRGAGWIAALSTATAGLAPGEVRADREFQGRLVESAVGAYLANAAACGTCELYYWRERNHEVDFVARAGRRLVAIEGRERPAPRRVARDGGLRPGVSAGALAADCRGRNHS